MKFRSYDSQCRQRVLAVAMLAALTATVARAAEVVGPTDAPIGIQRLSITYSGGTAEFDVRFDERSFNDVYDAGSSGMPFASDEDITAAMTAVGQFLDTLGNVRNFTGSTPTYDGDSNSQLLYPR